MLPFDARNSRLMANGLENNDTPTCAVCMEKLGTYGGPASLPCGHNGCLECLQKVQSHYDIPVCPLCRTPFDSNLILRLNLELREALQRVANSSSGMLAYSMTVNYPHDQEWGNNFATGQCNNYYSSDEGMRSPRMNTLALLKGGCKSVSYSEADGVENDNRVTTADLPPEVTVGNVLNGLLALVTGRRRGVPEKEEGVERVSFEDALMVPGEREGRNQRGESWMSVRYPTAPPLVVEAEEEVESLRAVLEAEPPQWMPDSSSDSCMQCNLRFRPLLRGRHHCRFCGGLFCTSCSEGKCLLPVRFRERDPQRVCDICYERLEPVQRTLLCQVSNAAQIAIHDVTDASCARGWLNCPVGLTMEHEIYKAANTLRGFCMASRLKQEEFIPEAVLQGAKGLAILSVMKVGMLVTYKLGTGLVVGRRADGSWSAPSAIVSGGLGWGVQVGGELIDFILVLRNDEAVKAFSGRAHLSVGAGVSVAAGPVGRAAEADFRFGDGGFAACYTYSCSQGAFVGVSLEGNIVSARHDINRQFYGDPYLTPIDILSGCVESPRAATPLYTALHYLFETVEMLRPEDTGHAIEPRDRYLLQ